MNILESVSPRRLLLILVTFLTVWPAGALAQDTPSARTMVGEEDGSRYARLRYLEGQVTMEGLAGMRAGEQLELNVPILAGDRIFTGEGRVEIQFPDGSFLRLDQHSEIDVVVIADLANQWENRTVLRLASGSAILLVENIASEDDVFRVDTPTASVFILTRGIFRVDASTDGERTTMSSYNGVAEVVAEGASVLVRSGERTNVIGQHSPNQPWSFNYFRQDEFDRWNRARQGAYVRPYDNLPTQDVPGEIRPYVSELAYYGDWIDDPDYGWVWRPDDVDREWTPYLMGRWYQAPAGLTWVSYEPWGWAPYHYGRWEVSLGVGWVWIPGRVYSGGWVQWAYTPTYVGWCPTNYYNYPVVVTSLHFGHHYYPHRSWVFVDKHHIHHKHLQKVAVTALRTEEIHGKSVLMAPRTRRASGNLSTDSGRMPRAGADDRGERVSFRTLEGQGRVRSARETHRDGRAVRSDLSVRRIDMRDTPARRMRPSRTPTSGTLSSDVPRMEPRNRADSGRIQRDQEPRSMQRPSTARTAPQASSSARPSAGRVLRPEEQRRTSTAAPGNSRPRVLRAEDRAKLMRLILRQRARRTGTSQPSGGQTQQKSGTVQPQGPKRPASQGKVSRPSSSKGKSSAPRSRSHSKSSKSKKKNH
ncbi:MAG: hypothetical protein E2P04_01895 [Acidobacteria bacterium]|nr:MAG: hypothetical protein E2P04_01895 [Acidobacteriota bacterium]